MSKKNIFQKFISKKFKNINLPDITEENLTGFDHSENEAKKSTTNETVAAISMVLHLYMNSSRDEESEIITIDMPSAHYSPWALKSLVMKKVVRR
jgi:predicted HTH transcriptional regulator